MDVGQYWRRKGNDKTIIKIVQVLNKRKYDVIFLFKNSFNEYVSINKEPIVLELSPYDFTNWEPLTNVKEFYFEKIKS